MRTPAAGTVPARPEAGASRSADRRRVLLVQAETRPAGGREAVFAWVLHSLHEIYDVTVLTWSSSLDVAGLNRHYGTSVAAEGFRLQRPSMAMRVACRAITALDPDPGSLQPSLLLMRIAKRAAPSHDLVIDCEMESDLGSPGLQYIHYPWLGRFSSALEAMEGRSSGGKLLALLTGKLRPWMLMGDFSYSRMRANRTLTNSNWTGDRVRAAYRIETTTLYPPAPGVFKSIPWNERDNGFLCIGRIHPDKRIDWLIATLEPLRREIPGLHLHIAGIIGKTVKERRYFETVRNLVQVHSSWVTMHLNLPRTELAELTVRQRYGLHAMIDEHFGIAIAEMVRAGCIPFVHDSGGGVEIVANEPRLIYRTQEDLRSRIRHVAVDTTEQRELSAVLMTVADRFSPDRFVQELREVVASSLVGEKQPAGQRIPRRQGVRDSHMETT